MSLNLCLGLFLFTGLLSLLDDSLVLIFRMRSLSVPSGILGLVGLVVMLLIYGLMGITPIIPKRVFLPLILFSLIGLLLGFPAMIYCRHWLLQLDWVFSLAEVALVLGIGYWLRRGDPFRWFVMETRHLGRDAFTWLNLLVFVALNVFVVLPAFVGYLAVCTGLAAGHYTDGFVKLRPRGVILQSRKYAREDGKTILLFPMSHIAETNFYESVSESVSSNSIVLMEGVTDEKNLITNELTYKRSAKALHLAEQHEDLDIRQGELVRADVDVQEFSSSTIAVLNLMSLIHARGINSSTLLRIMQFSPPPDVENTLYADLLTKRNEHVLKELRTRMADADHFVIPWGVAHMAGIAKEIQKSGFHLVETQDHVSIRFWSKEAKDESPVQVQAPAKSK